LLEIDWIDADWPSQVTDGYGAVRQPLSALFELSDEKGKPALIYVDENLDDEDAAEKHEAKLFGAEDLVIGSRFFRCFRIEAESVTDEAVRKEYLKKLPAFILLDPRGNEVARINGRTSARRLFSSMAKAYKASVGGNLKKSVGRIVKLLRDLEKAEDRMANAKRAHADATARLEKKRSARNAKRVKDKEKALEIARKEFEALRAKVDELARPRPAKKA